MNNHHELVIKIIRTCLPKPLQKQEILPSQHIVEIGIDSLALMTLTVELENTLGIPLSSHVAELVQAQTVADILDLTDRLATELREAV